MQRHARFPPLLIPRSQSVREAVVGVWAYGLQITGAWPPVPSRRDVKLRASSRPQLSRASPRPIFLLVVHTLDLRGWSTMGALPSWRWGSSSPPQFPRLVRASAISSPSCTSCTRWYLDRAKWRGASLFPARVTRRYSRQDTNLVNWPISL